MEIGEPALQSHALKRRLLQILLLPLIFTAAIFSESKAFANGNPIELVQEDFYDSIQEDITNNLSRTYDLGEDIDVSQGSDPVFSGTFTGVLNGLRDGFQYTIFGLTRPLFDRIGNGGSVKNLKLGDDSDPVEVLGSGALANTLESGGSVENVNVTGNVTGNVVGNVTGNLTGNASTTTKLETARTIYGNSFDGTANLTQAIAGTYGGTGVDNGSKTISLGGNILT